MYAENQHHASHECLKDSSVVAMLRLDRCQLVAVPLVCPVCGRGPESDTRSRLRNRITRALSAKSKGTMCPVCLRG